jgi:shikimate 5-dehydrogenase
MKIALLGTGFGQAHAAAYAQRPDVDEVIVFGRTPEKLAAIRDQFGFATSTNLDGLISNDDVDLVDICLPTRMHADIAVQAMLAGRDVLIELPLASTLDDTFRAGAQNFLRWTMPSPQSLILRHGNTHPSQTLHRLRWFSHSPPPHAGFEAS